MFRSSPLLLPSESALTRAITRPRQFRQPGFEQEFDAATLFYDVISLDDDDGDTLVFIGPPLRNLLPLVTAGTIDGKDLGIWITRYYSRDRCCDVWIRTRHGETAQVELATGSYTIAPVDARNDIYAGKRVLYTLSKDNEINWLVDWARFHAVNHGADAVLLYDNASTLYTGAELEHALAAALPNLVVHVVDWPFPYGPAGWSATSGWDSDFCQAGAFHDARLRFLRSAASVLNCDVDELVVSRHGDSIFDAAERSTSGYIAFHGRWISNACREHPSEAPIRHGRFRYFEPGESKVCPTKWCVVPSRCCLEVQWRTHDVKGRSCAPEDAAAFVYRHFRGVSTNWKYQRYQPTHADASLHPFDHELDRALARAGIQ